jgi:hypothetical protein
MFKISAKFLPILISIVGSAIATVSTGKVVMANETLARSAGADPALQDSSLQAQVPAPTESTPPAPAPVESTPSTQPQLNSFSTTTKLQGQVIFGFNAGLSGDIGRNAIFGHRTRLELVTELGPGVLTTRLQASGLGESNATPGAAVNTPEGASSFAGGTDSSVGIDLLKYDLPIGPNTQVTIAANAAGADDFTDSINPFFDGDGASGSISRFGTRPSIYYLVSGAGGGVRHQFSPTLEGSLGYLTETANDPASGSGLTGGSYGAIAQLTYKPNENTRVGLTYVNAYRATSGTGSTNANTEGTNNMFGLQAAVTVNPKLALGGWVGYNKNNDGNNERDILNWAVTAAFPDLGAPGNLAGLVVGQEPRVTGSTNAALIDSGSSLHIEGFYQIKLSDSVTVTPGLIYLTAPDHNAANNGALIGTIRTTLSF